MVLLARQATHFVELSEPDIKTPKLNAELLIKCRWHSNIHMAD